MKILILFIFSVLLLCSQCLATSRRSGGGGGDTNKNNGKESENTGFWASRGKRERNDGGGYGVIRCGWIRSADETDGEELNWPPRLLDGAYETVLPDSPSLETRFKRSAGYPLIRDIEIPSQFQPHNLPVWWGLPTGSGSSSISGRIGGSDFANRELAWLKLMGKRNAEKDSSGNNNNGGNSDSSSVPFWAARG